MNNRFGKVLSVVLAAALLICETAFADTLRPAASVTSDAEIEVLLSCGEYAEGEVLLLLWKAASEETCFLGSSGEDLLSTGEVLMEVSNEAALTGIGGPAPYETEDRLFLGSPGQPDIQIVHIKSDTLSTRELMYKLKGDSRIMAVQPNYIRRTGSAYTDTAEMSDVYEVAEVDEISEVSEVSEEASEGSYSVEATAGALLCEPGQGTGPYPDLTGYQWGFKNGDGYNAMHHESMERLTGFDMGLEHWNDPAVENATGYVVILDTGIDYDNPDLADVMAHLTPEQNAGTNGGEFGYNVLDDSGDPRDKNGHGTHCAGIVAAGWNDFGTSGVCNGVKLIGVAAAGNAGSISDSSVLKGYAYISKIMDNGVEVIAINNSFGQDGTAGAIITAAITELGEKGAVTVFAAGNTDRNLDLCPSWTWSVYGNPYAITVGSSAIDGKKSDFSSYGQDTCDVYAPGTEIISTVPDYLDYYLSVADPEPVYLNLFNEGSGSRFYVGRSSLDDMDRLSYGSLTKGDLPACESEIDDNTHVSLDDEFSFDTAGGSMRLSRSGEGGASGDCVNLFIPVKKSRLSDIKDFDICLYSDQPAFLNFVFYWENTLDPADDSLYTRMTHGTVRSYKSVASTWINIVKTTASQKPLASEGKEFGLYTIPSSDADPDTVLLPVALMLKPDTGGNTSDVIFDSVGLGTADTHWNIMDGTSMAAPAVTGAVAVAAKIQKDNGMSLTGAESAKWRANYIKSHILKMDDAATTSRQGGMVNMSVSESELTPVINEISAEKETSVLTITGACFGEETGTVTIAGKECTVTKWSDTKITAVAPPDAATGEPVVRVTGKNRMTGAAKLGYRSPGGTCVFEDVLPSPADAAKDFITTGSFVMMVGYVSGSMAVTDDTVLAMFENTTNTALDTLMCFDMESRTWSTLPGIDLERVLYSGMAEKDGIIYISVTDFDYSFFGYVNHLYTYDTATKQLNTVDTLRLGTDFAAAGIVNAGGTLMLAGGLDSRGQATTENNVAILTVTDGKADIEIVGDLFFEGEGGNRECAISPRLTYFDGSLYAAGSSWCGIPQPGFNTCMSKVTHSGNGKWECESINSTLPAGLFADDLYCQPSFGLTSTDEGVFIVGATVMEGGERKADDTYILRKGSSSFEPWDRVFCLSQTAFTIATSYDGVLYGIGVNRTATGGDGNLYFAASRKTTKHTVTFDADGGSFASGLGVATASVAHKGTVTPPDEPKKDGFRFLDWISDNGIFDFDTLIEEDLTLTAKWEENKNPDPVTEPDDYGEACPSAIQGTAPVAGAQSVHVSWALGSDGMWSAMYGGAPIKNAFANISYNGKTYWYHFNENGKMDTGWILVNGTWYYMNESHDGFHGRMLTGWLNDSHDGYTYYLGSNGNMLTGWQFIDGDWYYFNQETTASYSFADGRWTYTDRTVMPYGAMYRNGPTPDGYMADGDGKWIR